MRNALLYVKTILEKSEQIKRELAALMDVSHIRNGMCEMNNVKIDFSMLVSQVLVEHDEEI